MSMDGACNHEWKDEYYGSRCAKCDLFYPEGCAPWDIADDLIELFLEGGNCETEL